MYSIPGSVAEKTVWSFSGNESVTLGPKESMTYHYTWDQRKTDGSEAIPGWYEDSILMHLTFIPGKRANHPSKYDK